jgi:putative membrane protein
VSYGNSGWTLLVAAIVFTLVNRWVRPLVRLLSLPLIVLTLGLFLVIVNVLMLELTDWLVPEFDLRSFGSALAAAVIVSAVNLVLGRVTRRL